MVEVGRFVPRAPVIPPNVPSSMLHKFPDSLRLSHLVTAYGELIAMSAVETSHISHFARLDLSFCALGNCLLVNVDGNHTVMIVCALQAICQAAIGRYTLWKPESHFGVELRESWGIRRVLVCHSEGWLLCRKKL